MSGLDLAQFQLLHLLRPWWLLGLPLVALIWALVRRRHERRFAAGNLIAPHLREALLTRQAVSLRVKPVDVSACAAVLMIMAAAGPTWSKQPSPWFTESAPLVVAIEVSDSMRSNDFLPTRLDRARFKVLDLIQARTGARTAVVAYAGSAHIVVPPSKDPKVIRLLLESLDPSIMPLPGANAAAVLPLAQQLLGERSASGTLLFVNDGFSAADVDVLARFASTPGNPALAALVVGREEGGVALMPDGTPVLSGAGLRLDTRVNLSLLDDIQRQADLTVIRAQATGDTDLHRLQRVMTSNLLLGDDPDAQWRDQGWWLLLPAALLVLIGFRRGWTSPW